MTATVAPRGPARAPAARIPLDVAVLCAVLLVPTAIAAGLDTRTLREVVVWAKPLKFELSLALHWATVALLLACLDPVVREGRAVRITLVAGAAATVVELLYILLQAARGRASHFNTGTLAEAVGYFALMGGAAVVLVAATGWIGVLVARHPAGGRRDGLWLGAVLGLVGGSVLTLLVTAPLSAGAIDGPGPWVGAGHGQAGLPLVGWNTAGGDLRVPHFIATHALQVLPLVGWLADRWAPRRARAVVTVAGTLLLLAVVATFAQAVAGVPLVRVG